MKNKRTSDRKINQYELQHIKTWGHIQPKKPAIKIGLATPNLIPSLYEYVTNTIKDTS